jgi:hypothetical protein
MNASTPFELLSTGSEFETASEEFERGVQRRSGTSSRGSTQRRTPPRRRPRPGRPPSSWPPRSFDDAAWAPWGTDAVPVGPNSRYRRCMRSCLESNAAPLAALRPTAAEPEPGGDAGADAGADTALDTRPDPPSPDEETTMHKFNCNCPRCNPGATAFEVMEFEAPGAFEAYQSEGAGESQYEGPYQTEGEGEGEYEGEYEYEGEAQLAGEGEGEGPFSEAEEIALAAELLSVSNEAELEQFLGNLWKGIKKVGSVVGQAVKPFAGVLRSVAKTALPFVGGALGSLIPIPGVGTAVGSALGGALSQALEMEYGEMELEDREFEMARSFVRIAGTAAQEFEQPARGGNMAAAVQAALASAAQQHLRHFRPLSAQAAAPMSGRWLRQGKTLVVVGT